MQFNAFFLINNNTIFFKKINSYYENNFTQDERLPGHLPEKLKTERSEAVRELADRMKLDYRRRFLGREQTLLVERNSGKSGARGYGEHYLPIIVPGEKLERNSFQRVKITGMLDDKERSMVGELKAES